MASAVAAVLSAAPASASVVQISGLGNPNSLVTGGAQETFQGVASGGTDQTTLTSAGVTYTSEEFSHFEVNANFGGNYNTTAVSLHGDYTGGFGALTIAFDTAVQAVAFNWGAADTPWILEAFNAANVSLGFVNVPLIPFNNQNGGNFYGIASSSVNISKLLLHIDQPNFNPNTDHYNNDFVFIDNFTTGAYPVEISPAPGGGNDGVPEPTTWALSIMGFGLAGAALRRRRTAPAA